MNEIGISRLLRGGVALSLTLVVIGTLMTFWGHPAYVTDHEALKPLLGGTAVFPRTLAEVGASLAAGHGEGFVTLGLLVLIATPFLRVGVAALGFWSARDKVYTGITLGVLGVLVFSLVLGKVG